MWKNEHLRDLSLKSPSVCTKFLKISEPLILKKTNKRETYSQLFLILNFIDVDCEWLWRLWSICEMTCSIVMTCTWHYKFHFDLCIKNDWRALFVESGPFQCIIHMNYMLYRFAHVYFKETKVILRMIFYRTFWGPLWYCSE